HYTFASALAMTVCTVFSALPYPTLFRSTGSASGGMGIALGAMADKYNQAIAAANIPPEVMHRVVAMASGGMDTLPHNGAVITLRSEEHTSEIQSPADLVCRLLLEQKKQF